MKAKKSLGQNFLTDEKVIDNLLSGINVTEKDLIIEIGPGMGALTKKLKKYNSFINCYEVDTRMAPYLDKIKNDKIKINYQDFLQVDLFNATEEIVYDNLYVIANIPYYITTPIIKRLLSFDLNYKQIVLLVQKEMADKLTAKVGDSNYCSLTILLQYYFSIKTLFLVDKKSFTPLPKVDSAFIELLPRASKEVCDIKKLETILKVAFSQKRKKIKNNLFNYDQQIISDILSSYSLTLDNRPQEIPLACYIDLANKLHQ